MATPKWHRIEEFCGGKFWDDTLLANASLPDFTVCFQHTVFVWLPCAFLFITAPILLFYSCKSKSLALPWTWLNMIKTAIALLLILVTSAQLFYAVHKWNQGSLPPVVYSVDLVYPLLLCIAMLILMLLSLICKAKGLITSGVIFLSWFCFAACGLVEFITKIKRVSEGPLTQSDDIFYITTFFIYYVCILAEVLLNSFADRRSSYYDVGQENPCPEYLSSFLSQLTFSWFTPLALAGWRRPLEKKDLWNLNECDSSRSVVKRWESYWVPVMQEYTKKRDAACEKQRIEFKLKEEEVKIVDGKQSKHLPAAPSVIWRICLCFKWLFLPATLYKLIADIIQFVSPQLLRMLIQFIQDPAQPVWRGYFYAVSLLLVAVVYSFLLQMYFHGMFKAGMNIRSALVSAIFNKSLRLSSTAKKTSTVGEIVNLMSVDAQRYMDIAPFINMLWSCPLQIVVSLYFLWEILGPSVLAGVTVMVLLVPVNGFVASRQKAYQVLKLYAWETAFEQKLLQIRHKELQVLKSASYLSAFGSFTWICAPFIVAAITFAAYVLSSDENILTPEVAFVSLSLFNILQFPMSMLPMMITMLVQASVSNKRVKEFLVADELDTEFVSHKQTNSDNDVISIEKGTFNWDKDSNVPTLQNIELKVPRGSLVAVVGQVGSGKSSLLSALLGEMESAEGSTVNVVGSIAYCPQQAWIQNAPLRDNVIFGKKFEDADYNRIVDACALRPDFATLPGGDKTEIGEKGINLSGGQKQRVSLARALYQNCDIYLLDDPLSAVDAHVGKHIFDHVVGNKGLLKDKTRILVTHGLSYLKYVDKIVVMKEGKISEAGSYSELLEKRGAFAEFLSTYLLSKEEEEEEEVEEETEEDKVAALLGIRRKRRTTTKSASDDESAVEVPYMNGSVTDGDVKREATKRQISRGMSVTSGVKHQDSVKSKSPTPEKKKAGTTIIETERAEIGRVRSAVYLMYIKALGYLASIVVLFTFAISNAFNVGSSIWLADWSNDVNMTDASNDLRLGVYAGLGIAQGVFIFFGSLLMSYVMVLASEKLHKDLLHNLLRSPLSFYDVTPLGRIVNRVGKDVDTVDNAIPMTVRTWILCVVSVISTLIVIVVGTPVFAVMIIPLGILYFFVQRFYVATSRQLKRMESVTRSPIYSHFQETVSGASSIRAYGVQKRFIYMSEERVDDNQKTYYPNIVSNRWLAIRLEFVGNCVVFFAAVFAVLSRDTINAGLVGLSVSYAMSITQTLNWAVRMTSDLETNIVAVERIKEYSETPTEASWESESDKKPNPNWPKSGQMKFSDYAVRYRPELDPVLRGISCNISGGEKIGIVGRTGAGKSSLTMGLFRIIEADGGKIVIDDIDVSKLGLHDLRSKLTIIPQDPVLFSSSLRFNLDPFGKYSDSELWNALENAHLKSFISSLPDKLEHKITEGGDNLSVGQRQLICLARALLRKTKVLILDEATAAVDLETDDLIQQTIRKEFADCTILTIAHRLNTIMDSTRVMVLDKGRIAELDTVPQLLAHRNSIFHGMAKDAGLL